MEKSLSDKMGLGDKLIGYEVMLSGHSDKNYPDRKMGMYDTLLQASFVEKGAYANKDIVGVYITRKLIGSDSGN